MFAEYEESLLEFLADLSTSNVEQFTAADCKLVKNYIRSDGCTGVPDYFVTACREHDFYYRTHHAFCGRLINRAEADKRFRKRIMSLARQRGGLTYLAGIWISWWRWAGVRILGGEAWNGHRKTAN